MQQWQWRSASAGSRDRSCVQRVQTAGRAWRRAGSCGNRRACGARRPPAAANAASGNAALYHVRHARPAAQTAAPIAGETERRFAAATPGAGPAGARRRQNPYMASRTAATAALCPSTRADLLASCHGRAIVPSTPHRCLRSETPGGSAAPRIWDSFLTGKLLAARHLRCRFAGSAAHGDVASRLRGSGRRASRNRNPAAIRAAPMLSQPWRPQGRSRRLPHPRPARWWTLTATSSSPM